MRVKAPMWAPRTRLLAAQVAPHSCGRDDGGERVVRAVAPHILDLFCEPAVLHGPVDWDCCLSSITDQERSTADPLAWPAAAAMPVGGRSSGLPRASSSRVFSSSVPMVIRNPSG